MNVFVLLCSLGIGFYLVLLVNLHNDGLRQRRAAAGGVRTVKLGTVFERSSTSPVRQASLPNRGPRPIVVSSRRDNSAAANVVHLASRYGGSQEPSCS